MSQERQVSLLFFINKKKNKEDKTLNAVLPFTFLWRIFFASFKSIPDVN